MGVALDVTRTSRADLDVCRRRLYGDATGRWLVLDGPAGFTPPEQVDGLRLIGDLSTVLLLAQSILEQAGYPPLASLARLLGMAKTSLDNALTRDRVPSVPDAGWSTLVRYLIDPESVTVPTAAMGRPWPQDGQRQWAGYGE
jgi:hypothetical protein